MSGVLYLIPCPISEGNFNSLPLQIAHTVRRVDHFVVERARTARRFIKSLCPEIDISSLDIFELNKNHPEQGLYSFLKKLESGTDIGVLSEAGCPGIADPGHLAVQYSHRNNIQVVPLVGPSSIFLALMASGMNGQNFAFNGYLPNKSPALIKKLRQLESLMLKTRQTQLFMDAPYRNTFLLNKCVDALHDNTLLCIACDLDSPTQDIKCMSIVQWKKQDINQYHKRPAIFLLGI